MEPCSTTAATFNPMVDEPIDALFLGFDGGGQNDFIFLNVDIFSFAPP